MYLFLSFKNNLFQQLGTYWLNKPLAEIPATDEIMVTRLQYNITKYKLDQKKMQNSQEDPDYQNDLNKLQASFNQYKQKYFQTMLNRFEQEDRVQK